jgi:Tetratricopeptide repeat
MRKLSAALAVAVSLAFVGSAAAQSAAPTPTPRGPELGQPPGPGPGDVLPAPDTSPVPGAPGGTATPPGTAGPPGPAIGQAPGAPGQGNDEPAVQFTRAEQLDQLFILLKAAPDGDVATAVEKKISAIWMDSGSDTIDLLTKWADDAINAMDYPLALDYLDRITTLKPDFVEGWDKRANVYFMTEDYGRALADLEHVLALEPRHFGALAGLGTIMRALGEDQKALVAYKAALAIDPNLQEVKDAIAQLRDYDTHT